MNYNDRRFQSHTDYIARRAGQLQGQLDHLGEQVNRVQRPASRPAPPLRRKQSHVKERLDQMTASEWSALANRAIPLPDDMPAERLLDEMGRYLLSMMDQRWGLDASGPFSYTPARGQTRGF